VAPNAQSPFISRADKIVTEVNFRGEEVSGVEQRTPARETVQRDLHLGNLLTRFNRGPSSQTLWLVLDDVGVLFNPCAEPRANFATYAYNVSLSLSLSSAFKIEIVFETDRITVRGSRRARLCVTLAMCRFNNVNTNDVTCRKIVKGCDVFRITHERERERERVPRKGRN